MSTLLDKLRPIARVRLIDLVQQAGLDVSDWANVKGGKKNAATNPKYCYEWSFVQDDLLILNLWYENMQAQGGSIIQNVNLRYKDDARVKSIKQKIWQRRAEKSDALLQQAYYNQLNIRVVINAGTRRKGNADNAKASSVKHRLLDPVVWSVTDYEYETGRCTITRGAKPAKPKEPPDHADEYVSSAKEGAAIKRMVTHRKREYALRKSKILKAIDNNNGRLLCEVPNCGFDFHLTYGELGREYAQVHHKIPLKDAPPEGLKTQLEDLAIVCANCHVMIHRNGECRPLEGLIKKPSKKKKTNEKSS